MDSEIGRGIAHVEVRLAASGGRHTAVADYEELVQRSFALLASAKTINLRVVVIVSAN